MYKDLIKEEYQEIFEDISMLLFKNDPMCINFLVNEDEYYPEAATIVLRLSKLSAPISVYTTLDVIHEEFKKWFTSDSLIGPKERYIELAYRICDMWNDFREKQQIKRNQ